MFRKRVPKIQNSQCRAVERRETRDQWPMTNRNEKPSAISHGQRQSSIQHPASSIQHPHPASSIQHPASCILHPAPIPQKNLASSSETWRIGNFKDLRRQTWRVRKNKPLFHANRRSDSKNKRILNMRRTTAENRGRGKNRRRICGITGKMAGERRTSSGSPTTATKDQKTAHFRWFARPLLAPAAPNVIIPRTSQPRRDRFLLQNGLESSRHFG